MGGSFEIGRPRSRGWKNFGCSWTRGMGGLENWTIFMDVICVSSLIVPCLYCLLPEAATIGVLLKKAFVNFTEKHLQACNFIKKRLQHSYFPVKFTKFLRTPILKNICQRLLLYYTRTIRCYLFVLLYIQYLLPHHHCYCC